MFQPRQPTPTHSPTPSKSSLRRTSGSQNPSQRSLIPPPSPRFEDQPAIQVRYSPRSPPNQILEYESDDNDEPLIYPEPPPVVDEDSYFPYSQPERPFQSFFTLVEDGLTSEHHHPSVHYIFADDDTELITEAALRSLKQDELRTSSTADNQDDRPSHTGYDAQTDTRLPSPANGVREHYLILDVHPVSQARAVQQQLVAQPQSSAQVQLQSQSVTQSDQVPSYAITSFASLSPDWQISTAQITSAPTMSDTPGEDEGLMLRIEGRGFPVSDDFGVQDMARKPIAAEIGFAGASNQADDKTAGKSGASESLEEMIERFQSRLGEVKKLIEIDHTVFSSGNPYRDASAPAGGGDAAGDPAYHESVSGIGYGLEEQD